MTLAGVLRIIRKCLKPDRRIFVGVIAPIDRGNAKFRWGASSESEQSICFAGSALGAQRHVCAFWRRL